MINAHAKKICKLICIIVILAFLIKFISIWRIKLNVQKIYESFLLGEMAAIDKNMEKRFMDDLFDPDDCVRYLYCDIDCDGGQELHIRSDKFYYILKYDRVLLKVIYEGTAYEYPVVNKDICGVLYFRYGEAPINEVMYFTKFNKDGKEAVGTEFRWYDTNENNRKDEEDIYLSDSIEQTMDIWMEETAVYRGSAGRESEWSVWRD